MKPGMYTQCHLQRGNKFKTAWIPSKYAHRGAFIKIKDEDGEWEDGWEVVAVYTTMHAKVVEVLRDQHRDSRKEKDI